MTRLLFSFGHLQIILVTLPLKDNVLAIVFLAVFIVGKDWHPWKKEIWKHEKHSFIYRGSFISPCFPRSQLMPKCFQVVFLLLHLQNLRRFCFWHFLIDFYQFHFGCFSLREMEICAQYCYKIWGNLPFCELFKVPSIYLLSSFSLLQASFLKTKPFMFLAVGKNLAFNFWFKALIWNLTKRKGFIIFDALPNL